MGGNIQGNVFPQHLFLRHNQQQPALHNTHTNLSRSTLTRLPMFPPTITSNTHTHSLASSYPISLACCGFLFRPRRLPHRRHITPTPSSSISIAILNADDDGSNEETEQTLLYERPKHSDSFLKHLEAVKSSWPYDGAAKDGNKEQTASENEVASEEGVFCTGEPAMDPSRMVQGVFDGESNWI